MVQDIASYSGFKFGDPMVRSATEELQLVIQNGKAERTNSKWIFIGCGSTSQMRCLRREGADQSFALGECPHCVGVEDDSDKDMEKASTPVPVKAEEDE